MVLYRYSLQICVLWKKSTTSKLYTINTCFFLFFLIFSFSINILLEQIALLVTHIKHFRSTVLYYGRRIQLIKSKKFIDFSAVFANQCSSYLLRSFFFILFL